MLVIVLVYLVVQGRHQEKQGTSSRPVEVIRESPPSLIRVVAPDDLGIIEASMELGPPSAQGSATGVTATHRIVVVNRGNTSYHSFVLRLSYIGPGEKVLETRMVPVPDLLQPGQVRSITEMKIENVPATATKCFAKIASADLEPVAAKR
jgi:hypothetical protein